MFSALGSLQRMWLEGLFESEINVDALLEI